MWSSVALVGVIGMLVSACEASDLVLYQKTVMADGRFDVRLSGYKSKERRDEDFADRLAELCPDAYQTERSDPFLIYDAGPNWEGTTFGISAIVRCKQ